jgi:hypothetical protein
MSILMECSGHSSKRDFIALNAYTTEKGLFKINDLSFQPKVLEQ